MREINEQKSAKQTPVELPTEIAHLWAARNRANDLNTEAYDKLADATSKRQKAKMTAAVNITVEEIHRCELAILCTTPTSLADLAIQIRALGTPGGSEYAEAIAQHAERFAMIGKSALPEAILSFFRPGTGTEEYFALMRSVADVLYEACDAIDEGRGTTGNYLADLSARALRLAADRLEDHTIEGNEALRALGQSLEEGGAS